MLNNQLKNTVAPWQDKGRWYKLFVESTGSKHVLTTTDLEDAHIAGSLMIMPLNFTVIDHKYDIHSLADGSAHNISYVLSTTSAGEQAFSMLPASGYDYMTIWVFGYFTDSQGAIASTMALDEIEQ